MADLRNKLKTASFRNQSLQDILKSCSAAIELISVEPYTGGIHNTKMTLKLNRGDNYPIQERYYERIHFYNRVSIARAIEGLTAIGGDLSQIVENYNLQGCDFTVDDVELVSGVLKAKIDSLGYYNEDEIEGMVDYALITIPTNFISLTINGTVIQGTTENGGYIDLSETLKSHGIFPINTNDNYGCNNLYRLQAMTETELNIVLVTSNGEDEGSEGVSYLPGQPNTTIVGTDLYNNFGWDNSADIYKSISFTLGPRNSLTQNQINNLDKIFIQNEFVLDSRANAYGHQNIRMEIYFDDQLVYNDTLENSTKTGLANNAINNWLTANNSSFSSTMSYQLNAPYLSFFNPPANQWLKVTLVAIYTGPTVPITVNDGVLSHFDNAGLVTHGVDRKTAEFYIFDPFNF